MKKVGVITLFNITNFGGTLQAVALSKALERIGLDPYYIRHQKPVSAWCSVRDYLRLRKRLYGVNVIRMAVGSAKAFASNIYYLDNKKKVENFDEFRNSNLKMTEPCPTVESLASVGKRYDGYITGSDQVWNDVFSLEGKDDSYFLDFVDPEKPCFSYAASTGGVKSEDYIKRVVKLTGKYRKISVREDTLREAMMKLGAEDVKTVLDPTMLHNAEEWRKLERRPGGKLPPHYIVLYYLDKDTFKNPVVETVRKGTGLPVIDLHPSRLRSSSGVHADRKAGPREFLYWFSHADYVVTNSFHACVFSLIFHRKFVTVQRPGQESRIADLLRNVGLENHILQNPDDWKVIYEEIPEKFDYLEKCKAESYEYLNQIKSIIEE